jgi:hypothetical protein
LLDVAAYSSAVYLFIVVFLAAMLLGIVAVIVCSGFTVFLIQLVRNPTRIPGGMSVLSRVNTILTMSITLAGADTVNSGRVWRKVPKSGMRVVRVPGDARETVIEVLRERPLLPLSFTCLEDGLFLIVNNKTGEDWVSRIVELLEQVGVKGASLVSPLLEEAVLGLPLLESAHGIALSEYVIVEDKAATDKLIELWPSRMTVHPASQGLRIVVRAMDAAGLSVQRIPHGWETSVVVGRDLSMPAEEVV